MRAGAVHLCHAWAWAGGERWLGVGGRGVPSGAGSAAPAAPARKGGNRRAAAGWALQGAYLPHPPTTTATTTHFPPHPTHLDLVKHVKLKPKLAPGPLPLLLGGAGRLAAKLVAREGAEREPLVPAEGGQAGGRAGGWTQLRSGAVGCDSTAGLLLLGCSAALQLINQAHLYFSYSDLAPANKER